MASSLIRSSHHIDFESLFGLADAGMVQMFETLITTGLKEFLGCPAVFFKAALTEFFANSSVREDGMVVSTIGGTTIETSQEMFAAAFEFPTEGLIDLTDVPKDFVFDARSLFSDSKEQVSMSCLKKAMKFQYRLLHDILAKTIYDKAGSFDSVTRDRFLLMKAITFDVKINWISLLFGFFKEMVTPGSRQAKGYAIQICVLLRNVPGLELGESKAFPVPRVLNEKTVRRYVSINERIGVEEVTDAPRAKKTPVKKTVSKKRQATGDAGVGQVVKKKRTTKGKPVAAKRISVEKQVDDCSTAEPPVEERATGVHGTSTDVPVSKDPPASDPDDIIEQILIQLDTASATKDDNTETWFDRAFDEEFASTEQEKQDSEEQIDFDVAKTGEEASSSKHQPEELMSLDDLLMQITEDMMLPSVSAAEITKIRLGESINIPGVQEHDLYYASLPRISVHDKGKEPLVEDEPIKGNPARETIDSDSSDGSTVYCSPSSPDASFALGPVVSPTAQEENLYFVESPESPPHPLHSQDSTSSSSGSPVLFDSADIHLDSAADAQTSLPIATVDLPSLLDALQASLCQRMDDANNEILSRLHSTERSLQTYLGHQNDYLRRLIESARQEGQTQDDIQLLRLNELKKSVMAHDIKAGTYSLDVRNKLNALDAKVLLLDGGGDAKNGEGSSSLPLSTPINQGVSSSGLGRGLSVEEAAEIV
ncbi:hypothetical protein F511_31862 [Dorcoceras hygrometricum]|uniref:Dystroglycan-like n=1 Tax=Dorcoceras hygrometricum TaxID=472368 RepID=A0A2Z7A2H0_9LAMI|nr:hypothetical protein F511_31862 [Dorcoceras hygrometricum]